MEQIEAKGHNGRVVFDGVMVTIYREGMLARMTQGSGSKSIPVRSIGAIQFKPAGLTSNGHWSLSVSGEVSDSKGTPSRFKSTRQASRDENSVVVTRKQNKQFEALTHAINRAIASL